MGLIALAHDITQMVDGAHVSPAKEVPMPSNFHKPLKTAKTAKRPP